MSINTLFQLVLDTVFPPTDIERTLTSFDADVLHSKISPQYIQDAGTLVFFRYRDPLVRSLIWGLKYHKKIVVAEHFAKAMYPFLMEELSERALFDNFDHPLLVPIPLSKKKERGRGYNQSALLVNALIDADKDVELLRSDPLLLVRRNADLSQTAAVGRNKRFLNVRGTFSITDRSKIQNQNIIIVDDVITTGSTIKEAEKVLREAGARNVLAIAMAH